MYQTIYTFDYKLWKHEATTVFKTWRDNTVLFLTRSLIFENILMMSECLKTLTFLSKQVKTSASRTCYNVHLLFLLSVQHFSSANLPRFLPSWQPPLFLLWNWSLRRQVTFLLFIWQSLTWDRMLKGSREWVFLHCSKEKVLATRPRGQAIRHCCSKWESSEWTQ